MTPSFVVDCSVAMAWCFADEATDSTGELLDRLIEESAVVPAHWFLEVANVLVMANRRNRIGVDDVVRYAELLSELEVEVDPESPARLFGDVLQLAQTHRLTSYDAAYLELAIRRKLTLATLDLELRGAAESVGVNLLGM